MTNKRRELINELKKSLTLSELQIFYKRNNINFQEIDTFHDLAISLTETVHSTYLGDDVMKDGSQLRHFDWCWQKVLDDLKKENLEFKPNSTLYKYFVKYFKDMYYTRENKGESARVITRYWDLIMSYNTTKPHGELRIFLNLYKLMRKNLVIL